MAPPTWHWPTCATCSGRPAFQGAQYYYLATCGPCHACLCFLPPTAQPRHMPMTLTFGQTRHPSARTAWVLVLVSLHTCTLCDTASPSPPALFFAGFSWLRPGNDPSALSAYSFCAPRFVPSALAARLLCIAASYASRNVLVSARRCLHQSCSIASYVKLGCDGRPKAGKLCP